MAYSLCLRLLRAKILDSAGEGVMYLPKSPLFQQDCNQEIRKREDEDAWKSIGQ